MVKEFEERARLGIMLVIEEAGEAGNRSYRCKYTLGSDEIARGEWKTNKAAAKADGAYAAWQWLRRMGYVR